MVGDGIDYGGGLSAIISLNKLAYIFPMHEALLYKLMDNRLTQIKKLNVFKY